MSVDPILNNFVLEYSGSVDDLVPVYKYKSLKSGAHVVFAQIEGPVLKGYFSLATEAQDDDGLPTALKYVSSMGSEDYPYKVYGWTLQDYTLYTVTTAGSEGFLNLMPVYLDHILFPTLKESAYMTEVHHINGEGEDGGVMYLQIKEDENYCFTVLRNEMLREMYPGHCGYKSVNGGITKNIRESTSLLKVKSYHAEFYRPENLCIIVAGMVEPLDVLKTFLKFEEKIVRRPVDRPVYVRPWQSAVPPLPASVERTIKYECDEEIESGQEIFCLFFIAWRGPFAKDQVEMTAMMILFEYLTEDYLSNKTSSYPLNNLFTDLKETSCEVLFHNNSFKSFISSATKYIQWFWC